MRDLNFAGCQSRGFTHDASGDSQDQLLARSQLVDLEEFHGVTIGCERT